MKETFYSLDDCRKPGDLQKKLVGSLGLSREQTAICRLVYFDTFDWRLFRDDLYLLGEMDPDGARLKLVEIDSGRVVATLATGGEFPRLISDIPAGPLGKRLKPVMEMRALLPMADLKLRRHAMPLKDGEGKTRARLYIESFGLVTGSGRTQPVCQRLRLQSLKGYARAAEKIGTILQTRYELQPSVDDLFARSMSAGSRIPGSYSSKLNIALQQDARADAAVREVLQVLFDAMLQNEQGAIDDLDSEFLHDFRVAVRRTRSVLDELGKVFPPATRQRFQREFAWLGGLTSDVRDLDVYLLKFEKYQAALPRSMRKDLEPLRNFLLYKQRKEQGEHLALELRAARYRKLKQQWQRYLQAPLPKRPTERDAARPVGEVARHRTWKIYKRVLREGTAITVESPHEELHELRKSCKKLRYLMEFFQSLYAADAIGAMIRELKLLQENLGDFQDLEVQINQLGGYVMEMRRRGEYSAATGRAMDALLEILRRQMMEVRARFDKRFTRFARPANQKTFRKLLH